MNDEITLHQVIIRFHELDKFRDGCIPRLDDFINYDGLVAANNPIVAINVDIRSYCFDHLRVRDAIYRFTQNASLSLGARCNYALDSRIESSKDVVGEIAREPIREVIYVIDILK